MLDKNLSAHNLYLIAQEEELTPDLVAEIENHPASYRALKLWAQLELETRAGSPVPVPPAEVVPRHESSSDPAPLPVRKSFNIRKVIVILGVLLLVVVVGLWSYVSLNDKAAGEVGKAESVGVKEKVVDEDKSPDDSKLSDGKLEKDKEKADDFSGSVAAGAAFSCTGKEKTVTCVGVNNYGQLGTGASASINFNSFQLKDSIISLTAGSDHACAVTSGGLVCWGDNRWKQAGDGEAAILPPTPVALFAGKKVDSVSAGTVHTCVTSEGKLYCFGSDYSGQFGSGQQGAQAGVLTEIKIPDGQKALMVVAQDFSSCVSTDKGRLYCFGSNADKRISQEDKPFIGLTQMNQVISEKK